MQLVPRASKRSVIACLGKKRLIALSGHFELGVAHYQSKAVFVDALLEAVDEVSELLSPVPVAELRAICRAHELRVSGTKGELIARIGAAVAAEPEPSDPAEPTVADSGAEPSAAPAEQLGLLSAAASGRGLPSVGEIVRTLPERELHPVARRLVERHEIPLAPGRLRADAKTLAAALDPICPLPVLLTELDRARLRKVCTRYGITPAEDTREGLMRAILAHAAGVTQDDARAVEQREAVESGPGSAEAQPDAVVLPADAEQYRQALDALPRGLLHRVALAGDPAAPPRVGELLRARHRQYVVSAVEPSSVHTVVTLVCLDDDAQGRELKIVWELELGVERVDPARNGLGQIDRFDDREAFSAYLHALRWNGVTTATNPDEELVQAPFRAGITIMQHQLVPLRKVLELPRANLFIADDVGLGKTIEAGLIVQELLLRQRLDFIVVVCPASIVLQWQAEMEQRFGLRFEVVNRDSVARVRRQRGAGVNPWTCGRWFVVSYQTLRRPEYQESLREALRTRGAKSMLVLDEAHTVAPASNQQRYAVDSQLTKLARAIAPAFENRLFLSATPHNGHSNSFSALLELLDPTRFTRGVPVDDPAQLDKVMVRRLKRDLAGYSTLHFPERRLVELQLHEAQGQWTLTRREPGQAEAPPAVALGERAIEELELSRLLAEYTALCSPRAKRDRQVFIGLQKRLLSSVAAFERTLGVHLAHTGQRILAQLDEEDPGEVPVADPDGERVAAEHDQAVHDAVDRSVPALDESVRAQAEAVVARMEALARGASRRPEAKILALVHWIREHQCPAAGRNWLATEPSASTQYSDVRLVVFTEYADTARYIIKMLRAALAGTDREDDRIAYFHGSMSDEGRQELQRRFNARPDQDPVRILVATDAAREGVNLQAHCADLLHYDIPWNPGRLEQRNGRIDRTLQPSPQVRCMYFAYPQRAEDRVLTVVVEKVERIGQELGSLSAVVLERMEEALLPHGIDEQAQQRLSLATEGDEGAAATLRAELGADDEREGDRVQRVQAQVDEAGRCYGRSKRFFAPDAQGLRHTVEQALGLAGAAEGFAPTDDARDPAHPSESQHYRLPQLPPDWQRTLDPLRVAKAKDQGWWEWRNACPPRPVVFEPLSRLTDEVVQLHLEHPVVRRALRRFSAQGYAAHDLRRAALLRYAGARECVVLVGRLSLFGHGATRLHDGLMYEVAERRAGGELVALGGAAAQSVLEPMHAALRQPDPEFSPSRALVEQRLASVTADVQSLWPRLRTAAGDEAEELIFRLDDRGAREAQELTELLSRQQQQIERALHRSAGTTAAHDESAADRQRRLDRAHLVRRAESLRAEREREPEALRHHYRVLTRRIEAVGVVYLFPRSR